MSDAQPRHMKYPYTATAKVMQFPWKFYFTHSWLARYMVFATILSVPIFYKIQKLSKNPANVEKWNEIERKAFSGEH